MVTLRRIGFPLFLLVWLVAFLCRDVTAQVLAQRERMVVTNHHLTTSVLS